MRTTRLSTDRSCYAWCVWCNRIGPATLWPRGECGAEPGDRDADRLADDLGRQVVVGRGVTVDDDQRGAGFDGDRAQAGGGLDPAVPAASSPASARWAALGRTPWWYRSPHDRQNRLRTRSSLMYSLRENRSARDGSLVHTPSGPR